MNDFSARQFWEKKILKWERSRYGLIFALNPFSWTVRNRLKVSTGLIEQSLCQNWSVIELGCGSGYLAEKIAAKVKTYCGYDIAENAVSHARARIKNTNVTFKAIDVLSLQNLEADLIIFLGLTDWLNAAEIKWLFSQLKADHLFFSFTELRAVSPLNPYFYYRRFIDRKSKDLGYQARHYSESEILALLITHGYTCEFIRPQYPFDPGVLVKAKRC